MSRNPRPKQWTAEQEDLMLKAKRFQIRAAILEAGVGAHLRLDQFGLGTGDIEECYKVLKQALNCRRAADTASKVARQLAPKVKPEERKRRPRTL